MKTVPDEIDPKEYPELAHIQAIIHDEDRTPAGRCTTNAIPLLIWVVIW